jgi:hypothetical protein
LIAIERLALAPTVLAGHAPVSAMIQSVGAGRPPWVDVVVGVAQVVIAIALVVAAITMAVILVYVRRMATRVNGLLATVQDRSKPIFEHARDVAENVDYISTSVRADVEEFKGTIQRTQARLDRAAQLAEDRLADFNGLIEVVQDEAERLFIDTASTARGIRASAHSLRRFRERDERAGESEPV